MVVKMAEGNGGEGCSMVKFVIFALTLPRLGATGWTAPTALFVWSVVSSLDQ